MRFTRLLAMERPIQLTCLRILPPKLSLLSPLSQTYNETNVTLTFTMDKPISWAAYSLDGKANITTAGNTTLIGLSSGLHNLTISANDTYGNMAASETVAFTVAEPDIAEPFPTATVAAVSAASAVLIGVGLIIYLKKHKHRATSQYSMS